VPRLPPLRAGRSKYRRNATAAIHCRRRVTSFASVEIVQPMMTEP
jgi:hypothetical protein